MSHLWNLVKKELRELLTPSSLASVVAMVAVFIMLGQFVGGEVQQETSLQPIAYVDVAEAGVGTDYAQIGVDSLNAYYTSMGKGAELDKYVVRIEVTAAYGTDEFKQKVYQVMNEKGVNTAIVLTPEFNTHLQAKQRASVDVIWNQKSTSVFSSLSTVSATTAVAQINSGIEKKLLQENSALTDAEIAVVEMPSTYKTTTFLNGTMHENVSPDMIYSALSQQTMFVPIIIMLIIVMIGSIVISSMGNEKENKTLETLLTLPVSRTTIVAGKLIGSAIAGLIMGAMYMVGMYFYINGLMGINKSGVSIESLGLALSLVDWVIVVAFVFLAILSALGLCMILGAFAKNNKSAQMLILPISILAMIPMFVTMFTSVDSLPSFMQVILFIIPFTHPMTVMQNLMFGQTMMVAAGAVYLVAFTLVTMFITVRIYKSDILLTGIVRKNSKKKGKAGMEEQPE